MGPSLSLGVSGQSGIHIADPPGAEAVLQVPVDGLLEALLPGGLLLPAQRRQLLVADVVPAHAHIKYFGERFLSPKFNLIPPWLSAG